MPKLPHSKIQEIRKAVRSGKSRTKVATEFGVTPHTAYRYTRDLPLNQRVKKRLTPEQKEYIRNLVKSGVSKCQTAKIMGVGPVTVYCLTKDFANKKQGNRTIRENSIKIMQKLVQDGYYLQAGSKYSHAMNYRSLLRYFPIRRVQSGNTVIYYLENRKEDAFNGFIKYHQKKVLNFGVLKEFSRLFGVPLSSDDRRKIIGKMTGNTDSAGKSHRLKKRPLRHRNAQISDFIGSFLPSELLYLKFLKNIKITGQLHDFNQEQLSRRCVFLLCMGR